MVSNYLKGNVLICILAIFNSRYLGSIFNDREQKISLKVACLALNYRGNTLQAHTCINVLILQVVILTILCTVKLGKYIVPDFQITVAITAYSTVRTATAPFLTKIDINLRVRTAWTRADFPEIIIQTNYMRRIKAWLLLPNFLSFLIIWINGSPELILWKFQNLSQELPCPRNSLLFEVITKGEISQHLKIGLMTSSTANILNVTCTYAALACSDTGTRRLYLAGKICLKWRHTSTNH